LDKGEYDETRAEGRLLGDPKLKKDRIFIHFFRPGIAYLFGFWYSLVSSDDF